ALLKKAASSAAAIGGEGKASAVTTANAANAANAAATSSASQSVPAPFESANWLTRTALCAEVRNGVFYLFMPPLSQLEHYLELVAAIEA
ncbi:transglutaminase family protein, partial [Acinetobacter baumannii]